MMRKRKSLTELLDGVANKGSAAADSAERFEGENAEHAGSDHLARLGEAFLARLDLPEGMSEEEAAERIISMWNEKDAFRASNEAEGAETEAHFGESAPDDPDDVRFEAARPPRLPMPIRGGLFEAPKADYESMSAEQFRRLKKQLERASMDGRRIRL